MSLVLRSTRRLTTLRRRYSQPSAAAAGDEPPLEPIDQRQLPTDYNPSTFDPSSPTLRPPPSDRVWRLVDDVSALTVTELADLSAILTRRLGMSSPPSLAVAGAGGAAIGSGSGAGQGEEKKEEKAEKTVFELRLDSYEAASKIKVIKEVRGFTDLGLKEAKELVEKTPAVIKRGVSKEEAEQIIEKMKAVGAKVIME